MLEPGTLLEGKYRILREIGRGGMSTVYLALNERANKTWAVKEIRRDPEDHGGENDIRTRGLPAELEMLRKLHHPHLPDIVDVISAGDSLLIVMEYIQGRDLQKILDEKKRADPAGSCALDPEAVRDWAIQLCDVLEYLHTRRPPVIYRDLKPANIMLRGDRSGSFPHGSVCLIDFGTAREMKARGSGDTVSLGTRGYAAPEQFGGQGETDARTDIFNLGATMYHLLTGYSPAQTNYSFLPIGELRPELQESGIERIVAKCCEPSREARYQTAAELRRDLENESLLSGAMIRRYMFRWRCFLASAALALAAAGSALFFGCARLHVRNTSYEAFIRRAQSAQTVPEGLAAWLDAVCLAPGKPYAYQALMDAVEADGLVTSGERAALETCLNTTAAGRALPNAGELRRSAPAACDRLMYRAGADYFFYYENEDGYQYAAQKLGNVLRMKNLDAEKNEPEICGSLQMIADFCVKQASQGAGESWISQTNAKQIWEELRSYTEEPAEAVSRCGTKRVAAAMYRELARQILQNTNAYLEAGVGEDRMRAALGDAEEFVDHCGTSSGVTGYDRALFRETRQAVEAASFRVEQLAGGT